MSEPSALPRSALAVRNINGIGAGSYGTGRLQKQEETGFYVLEQNAILPCLPCIAAYGLTTELSDTAMTLIRSDFQNERCAPICDQHRAEQRACSGSLHVEQCCPCASRRTLDRCQTAPSTSRSPQLRRISPSPSSIASSACADDIDHHAVNLILGPGSSIEAPKGTSFCPKKDRKYTTLLCEDNNVYNSEMIKKELVEELGIKTSRLTLRSALEFSWQFVPNAASCNPVKIDSDHDRPCTDMWVGTHV